MTDERKESDYKNSNEILLNNNSSIKHTDRESVSSNDKKKPKVKINSHNSNNQINQNNQISLKNFEDQKQSSTLRDEINSLKNSQRISNNSNKNQNNIQLNKVTKYKKENLQKGDSKVIPNRDSVQISKEDNIEQVEINNDINCRQRLTRFLELHDRLFYIKLIIYILSFASFVYYVVCTYINSLFSSLNYIDLFICTIYIFEHLINIILAHHFFFIYNFNGKFNIVFIRNSTFFFFIM